MQVSSPAPKVPSPVHLENLGGALDRASNAVNRGWGIVQSITDGSRAGSSQLDDSVGAIGKHLATAVSHAAKAGRPELVAHLGQAAEQALMSAQVFATPPGQSRFRPNNELSVVESASDLLVQMEGMLTAVSKHVGNELPPLPQVPARDDVNTDARTMAWAKAADGDLSRLPADIPARYPIVAAALAAAPTADGMEGAPAAPYPGGPDDGAAAAAAAAGAAAEGAGEATPPVDDAAYAAAEGAGAGEPLPPPTGDAPAA